MFRQVIMFDNPRDYFDIQTLEEHAESIVNVRGDLQSPFAGLAFETSVVNALRKIDFDVDKDAVVLIGRQTQICMSLLAVAYAFGPFDILIYSNGDNKYVQRKSTSSHFQVERADQTLRQDA